MSEFQFCKLIATVTLAPEGRSPNTFDEMKRANVRKSREGPLVTQASNSYLFLSALRASLSRHGRELSVIRYEKNNNEIPSLFQALG